MIGNKTIYPSGISAVQIVLMFLAALLLGLVIAKAELLGAGTLIAFPLAAAFTGFILIRPRYGLIATLFMAFLANGLSRYISAPVGLSLDIILLLTTIGTIFLKDRTGFIRAANVLTWLVVGWFLYTCLELFNPLSVSKAAWFYAVRGVSLYNLFLVPLAFILFNTRKDLSVFIRIWMVFSVLAAIWGVKQVYWGVDFAEQAWLNEGGGITHIIHNRLRAFSFYSDAGQFGAAMAHAGLAAAIIGLTPGLRSKKWMYFLVSITCFFGMVLSGTRGALYIPLVGFMAFLLMVKNFRVFALGIILIGLLFSFLKFTTIGQGDYNIRRMRSALDPNDRSLAVRKENQKKIAKYLEDKPFGAGIGSGGSWALRFAPDSFLATTPLDSWYVKIWAETGIVGLVLHIAMILFILGWTFYPIFLCPDPVLKYKLAAIYCGFIGVAFASYGNQIFGQSPTSFVLGISMVFMFSVKKLLHDKYEPQQL